MDNRLRDKFLGLMAFLFILVTRMTFAQIEDLGHGFRHHGIATPLSNHRGIVATVDGEGKPVVLAWLFDHRGGYALLLVDAETGKSEEFPMPFPPGGDCPYASILSSRNRYYTHFNGYFVEFDPAQRAFTYWKQTKPQMAMSMTEDDSGRIWSATYPQSGVVCYDPEKKELTDYGHVYPQNWNQYPRAIATDRERWVYFGVGSTACQIIALNPKTGQATPLVPEKDREHGTPYLFRDLDGKVYGQTVRDEARKDNWFMFFKGKATPIDPPQKPNPKSYVAGSQGLFHRTFPDGKRLQEFDLAERRMVVEELGTGKTRTFLFNYTSEGAHVMSVAAAPDNTICGGTAFPMRFFRYDPEKDEWTNRPSYGQWNTVSRQGDKFFVGGYTGGFLLEWDPAKPWVPTEKGKADSNPLFLAESAPTINRPHELLAHPNGKLVVLAGTPDYGFTGGGLLFWDRENKKCLLLTDKDVLPDQSTFSLVALPGEKLLGGSTTSPGTGGEKKAKEAELYILDLATKKIEWHQAILPGVQEYTDLCLGPDGLVYGFADRSRFLVFDPEKRKLIHERSTAASFGLTAYQQGPRVFICAPNKEVYILFLKGIARVEAKTFDIRMLAESPVPIQYGGDFLNGRIYFSSGSHLYSYEVKD
ncbi:MAG: hypothetical protein ACUVV5_05750 [Candidatus Aminicenantales bacterium]